MYKDVTRTRGQMELNFKRAEPMKPINSDFNVPNSDDEEDPPTERTPPLSEVEAEVEDDDHLAVIDAKHPKYLETFLKRSRLHYLSSTAVAKKVFVQDLRQKAEHRLVIQRKREELKEKLQRTERDYLFQLHDEKRDRIYMHIDMDCFFVSVVIRNQPELRDQPIVITHSKGKKSANTVCLWYWLLICLYLEVWTDGTAVLLPFWIGLVQLCGSTVWDSKRHVLR